MKLPRPPAPDEIARHIPRIEPVPPGTERPFWSVMIPTYNCAAYLGRTLQSVLAQDPGPSAMQIEVIDDGSTRDDPAAVVATVGKGRVALHRHASNRGICPTFNTCIQRSRGLWVHILHGDDMVLPTFYGAYQKVIEAHPEAALVYGPVQEIDPDDVLVKPGPMPAGPPRLVANFAQRQASEQLCATPAVVVRRAVYEQVGGFCDLFSHVADMDMWHRAGRAGSVYALGEAHALYRVHPTSDTSRLLVSARNIEERYVLTLANAARLPVGESLGPWRERLADLAEGCAWRLDDRGSTEGRLNQARWAWRLEPTPRRFLFLAKSWVKHQLRGTAARRSQEASASVHGS